MLKKITASFATLVLALLSFATLSVLSLAPASASIPLPDKITYCQAQGNGEYHPITPNVRSLVDNKGNFKQGGINAGDIIEPFAWDFGGDDHGTFPGQNWTADSRAFVDRDCVPLNSSIPVPVIDLDPATCSNLFGTLKIVSADPRLVQGTITIGKTSTATFTKPVDGTYNTYTWADGTKSKDITLSVTAVDPITDPLWDSAKGICRMPDTGGDIKSEHILYAGILIFAGLVLTTLVRRRKA